MTHEEWVSQQRAAAVATANKMLSGELGIIEGSRLLVALGEHIESAAIERLFTPFVVIDSDTNHFPVGSQECMWAPEALAERRASMARAEDLYRSDALIACAELIEGLEAV
jgi:hypothetical protein